MSGPVKRPKVTVLGAEELLFFETDEVIAPAVTVNFAAQWKTPDGKSTRSMQWSETGTAEPIAPDPKNPPPAGILRFNVRWTVKLGDGKQPTLDTEAAQARCDLSYVILANGVSGAVLIGIAREPVVVDRLTITGDRKLTRIMLHEFNRLEELPSTREGEDVFIFDPAPVQRYLDGLTPQQKKLLLNYDVSAHDGHRLVVFATLVANPVNMMGGDYCGQSPTSVIANATFAAFHCQGDAKGVELICYTEHLLINFNYFPAKAMVTAPRGGKPASEWTSKANPAPVLLKLSACNPAPGDEDGTHWAIYNRIFNPKTGVDEMKGNTLHGMINTKGCWMLFRNYNWPRDKYQQFSDVMTDVMRIHPKDRKLTESHLKPLGYDVEKSVKASVDAQGRPTQGRSSSYAKFLAYDKNSAFHWFFHEVVGIKYFSEDEYWTDHNVVARTFESTMDFALAGHKPEFNDADEGDNSSYYLDDRWAADRKAKQPLMKVDGHLFRTNCLGFQPASAFVSLGAATIPQTLLKSSSWADLYIYSEPGVVLDNRTANPPRRASSIVKPPTK